MKRFSHLFIVGCLAVTQHAAGQEENWDTYLSKFGDKPGSVLVDLGLNATAPDKRYPNLVITGPQAHNCNKQGIPVKEEIDMLEQILDATSNFLTGVTPKVLAGTFTYNCERVNYYYVKDTTNIRNALRRMYDRNFKDYNYAINIKADPEWAAYRTFLYPNEETLNWMENNRIMTEMMGQGDSLTKARDIRFDLYFRSDTDRKSFVSFANAKGYKVTRYIDPQKPSDAYELVISKYGLVKMEFIGTLTAELKKEAKMHHGYYNKWEAKP